MDLRQFKLSGDEEIICEVVEWPDEQHDTMVVKRALKIVAVEDFSEGMRYYTFRPWISMNNDPDALQILNPQHIIAESAPAKLAEEHYYDIIKEMREFDVEEKTFYLGDEDEDIDLAQDSTKDIVH